MKSYITISELTLFEPPARWGCVEGTRGIFPSLFDFHGDTKESLEKLVGIMYANELFKFSNTGDYAGIDNRNGMHFTFDDGIYSIQWLMKIFKAIADYNNAMRDNIKITLVKKEILEKGIMDTAKSSLGDRVSDDLADRYISLYVTRLAQILKRYRVNHVFSTQVNSSVKDAKYNIIYKNNCFLIVPKTTSRKG